MPQNNKESPTDVDMKPVGLGNIWIVPKFLPKHCVWAPPGLKVNGCAFLGK